MVGQHLSYRSGYGSGRMNHLYFVQSTKGIWVPGGLYEDKGQAIDDAALLNTDRNVLVRVPMGMKLHWPPIRNGVEELSVTT